jgi:hypothetical protein
MSVFFDEAPPIVGDSLAKPPNVGVQLIDDGQESLISP